MTQSSPADRLSVRIAHLPDACRALLAALDRQASRGGGEVPVRLVVTREGEVVAMEVAAVYERTEARP